MSDRSATSVRPDAAELILRHPGVARARRVPSTSGDTELHVVPFSQPDDGSAEGTVAGLAQINPHETRFLHDEIFLAKSYLQGGIVLREDAVVFDVGANIGMFSLFVAAVCPSARVYAFEPVRDVFEPLAMNVARHAVPAELFEIGLSDREQEVTFNFYPSISIMSCVSGYADLDNEVDLIKQYVDNAREHGPSGREEHLAQVEALVAKDFELSERRCRLRPLSAVVDEAGVPRIDLLKIDVQRAELDVLHGVDDRHWPLIQQVSMEVHDEAGTPTEGRVRKVRELLTARGFRLTVAEEDLLRGTGRYAVQAIRPGYADDPRPVAAAAGTRLDLSAERLGAWLAERLPAEARPVRVVVVDALRAR
ncbi:methyltransferase, FkbM family [Micromonospora matsumotoense]|uniref:Methyltransferase, FkbM family n=1 Tax=Micromonospora matsumotoense TaxID=121616 RepID=A0A1C5AXF3_9ACTN|nr:FkbM family methyltransferase [Micromonospora matsumotoense]SCF49731.1 methyltransferase, FkbM family [Micromonospora matsumotoense]